MDKDLIAIFLVPILVSFLILVIVMYFQRKNRHKNIVLLSELDNNAIIENQIKNKKESDDFNLKLIQAGITYKEYNEARLLIAIIGIIIMSVIPIFFGMIIGGIAVIFGIMCIIFGGKMYLALAKGERIEKINNDLGIFLDLVNVILEAGGSLKNAFFEVSRRGVGIIDKELLKEVAILEYEMTNHSTKIAYENLKERVDSREVDKVIDFLILSEETGIGVKNIFTMQSDEMRKEKFYQIKGKVNTLNMYMMLIIFLFVLPAFGAFVIFPMMGGTITIGL